MHKDPVPPAPRSEADATRLRPGGEPPGNGATPSAPGGEPAENDATRLAPAGGSSAPPDAAAAARRALGAPSRIGHYHLLRRIGEGGMGEVWEAEQREPIRRRVAIKLVKIGMDTGHFLARFEAERQALALMEHPAIARVIDGGATETGRPWLVMEFVEGLPITRYCDQRRLATRQRLELFLEVCEGVEHAHRRGILHRDLKPSNVLVADRDGGKPAPTIIDFGVAKAIAEPLTERTLHTVIGGWIGTPAYMSPEQADIRGDIDTRTDVYSLGVMLYELIAGVRPLPDETIETAAPDELRRLIREHDAPRPSTRISELGAQSTAIAAARSTEPRELERRLRGDLDWIVLKAIEKDRDRRYGSPSQLADDIRRHLRSEPVVARPPSVTYRAGRFVRRHKLAVAAGATAAAGLVAAVVGTGVGLVRARQAEAQAVAAAERAAREASTANRVTEFLVDLFAVTDPRNARGDTVTAREVLDRGAAKVRADLASEPVVQARLEQTIAEVYEGLGLYDQAEPLYESSHRTLQRELGDDDRLTLAAAGNLASLQWRLGRYDEARPTLERVLARKRETLGPEHPDTLQTQNNLASLFLRQGDHERAEVLYRQAWEIHRRDKGDDDPLTLGARNNLANVLGNLGRHQEELEHFEAVLERRRATQGADHPDALGAAMNLASAYETVGRLDEAEALALPTLAEMERVLGADHPDTLSMLGNVATLDLHRKRYDAAIERSRRQVDLRSRLLGPQHDQTLIARRNLALAYQLAGDLEAAEREVAAAVAGLAATFGPDHFLTLDTRASLALTWAIAGRNHEAKRELEAVLPALEQSSGPNHPRILEMLYNLACLATRVGEQQQALGYLERSVNGGLLDPGMLADPDLEPLRGDPRYDVLAEKVRAGATK